MAYIIEREEEVGGAIRRIVDEEIILAREQLTDASAPREERVHDARKRFKEIRAVIRLIRGPLGSHYALENAWFRDAGRDLAAARDADAVVAALDGLALPKSVTRGVRRELLKKHPQVPLDGIIANTVDQLVVAQARIGLWPGLDDSFDTIAPGLRKAYRDGRRAMKVADSPERIHEWRKVVKTHWYHVQLLEQVWPPMMKTSAGALKELSRALGDHHDLDVLSASIDAPPAVAEAIARRQQELEKDAFGLGQRVYAERPAAWLTRVRSYWKAWR